MTLENIQRGTNAQRVVAGNVSASNDPTQWQHDGREQLIKGAELAAAGRTLGMSEEETLAAVSRQYRRQRRADDRVTERDVMRQMVQAAATTTSDVGGGEIKGVGYEDTSEIENAFGQDQGQYYEYGPNDAQYEEQQREKLKEALLDAEDVGDQERVKAIFKQLRVNPEDKPKMAPKSVLNDALSAVLREKQGREGLNSKVSGVFGGTSEVDPEIDRAEAALRRHLEPEKQQDARIGRATVTKDRQRFNPEVQEANYYKAETDALAERRRLYGSGGYGFQGDVNLQRVRLPGEQQGERFGKELYLEEMLAPGSIQNEIARRYDGVFVDPETGNTVALQGPETPGLPYRQDGGSSNTSADALNAPQSAREWLAQGLGDRLERMRGSDRIQQVDITSATTTAANKVRDYYKKIGVAPTVRVPENIRSVEELQRVVDRVVSATGGNLTVPNPETPGKQMPAGRRTTEGALNAIGLTLGEQSQLSQAMYQLDAAKRSSVNENPTGVYLSRTGEPTRDVTFDSGDVIDEGMMKAKIARIPRGSTIRVSVEGKDKPQRRNIVDQLRQLPSPNASQPFMGQVEGEKPRVNRYTRTGENNPADAAIAVRKQAEARAKGGEVDAARTRGNQVRAMLLTEREKRDNTKRAEAASELIAQLPPNARRTRLGGR